MSPKLEGLLRCSCRDEDGVFRQVYTDFRLNKLAEEGCCWLLLCLDTDKVFLMFSLSTKMLREIKQKNRTDRDVTERELVVLRRYRNPQEVMVLRKKSMAFLER